MRCFNMGKWKCKLNEKTSNDLTRKRPTIPVTCLLILLPRKKPNICKVCPQNGHEMHVVSQKLSFANWPWLTKLDLDPPNKSSTYTKMDWIFGYIFLLLHKIQFLQIDRPNSNACESFIWQKSFKCAWVVALLCIFYQVDRIWAT